MDRGDSSMRHRHSAQGVIFIFFASIITALAVGLFGAIAAMFLYDQGRSKGNDVAAGLIGLYAAGTFTFVIVFTSLWSRRALVSWRIPVGAFGACIGTLVLNTVVVFAAYNQHYAVFIVAAWIAETVSGIAALLVCRRIVSRGGLSIKAID